MKCNKFGLLDRDMENLNKAFLSYNVVEKAVIFGSRAMGNYKKGSDIDIAIFGKNITYDILIRISGQINEELPIPYFVDVIHFETTENKELKAHILTEGKIIYQKC